ncbi:MAG: hypothetical protein ACOX66_09420 [Oscillospiraceae bacterium]|jgi:hypothetical protein
MKKHIVSSLLLTAALLAALLSGCGAEDSEKASAQADTSAVPPAVSENADGTTAESLGLADGTYQIAVTLSGGSGRASVDSPAELRIENGKATVTIVWSSPNYDYMKIGDVKYEPVNTSGNSAFTLPIDAFDRDLAVVADTVAMGEPHEIDYTLRFDSASITAAGEGPSA